MLLSEFRMSFGCITGISVRLEIILKKLGFTEKHIDLYAVPGAFFHRFLQLGKTLRSIFAVIGKDGGRHFKKVHGQPQTVDPFVGKFVQILIGIIILIVHQLIDKKRRTHCRPEKTAGNTDLHPGRTLPIPQRTEFSGFFPDTVLKEINGTAHAVGIGSSDPDRFFSGAHFELLTFPCRIDLKRDLYAFFSDLNTFGLKNTPQ